MYIYIYMTVYDISNICTYICMYIISTNPFFMGDSKQILHLNKKNLSGPYIPWIYSGISPWEWPKICKMTARGGPQKPILNGVK